MNEYNNDRTPPANEYPPEPTDARSRPSGDGATGAALDAIEGAIPPRRRTLKARIKRNMAGGGRLASSDTDALTAASRSPTAIAEGGTRSRSAEPPAATTTAGAAREREESVMAAASALASLGVTSPAAGAAAPSPFSGVPAGAPAGVRGASFSGSDGGRLPSFIRPPPIVAGAPSPRSALQPRPQPRMTPLPSLHELQAPTFGGRTTMETRPSNGNNLPRNAIPNANSGRPYASLLGSDVPLTFPQKLMEVLSNPDVSDAISWLPHGKGFVILQKRKFATEVMPLYFKHSKFTSFTRKLNRWGFSRVSKGPEMGAYYHKLFQRGNYLLCMQMHCHSANKPKDATKAAASSSSEHDPNNSVASSPPPPIETIQGVKSAPMSPLEEPNTKPSTPPVLHLSPSPAAVVPPNDHSEIIRRLASGGSASSGPHRPPAIAGEDAIENDTPSFAKRQPSPTAGTFAFASSQPSLAAGPTGTFARFGRPSPLSDNEGFNNSSSPFVARQSSPAVAGHGGTLARFGHGRQEPQHGIDNPGSSFAARQPSPMTGYGRGGQDLNNPGAFERAFSRQQEILRSAPSPSTPFPFGLDTIRGPGGSAMQPSSSSSGFGQAGCTMQSSASMQNRQQLHLGQQLHSARKGGSSTQFSSAQQPHSRPPRHSNTDQAIAVQRLLGVDTSSSRSHNLVIANALKALKNSSNQDLLGKDTMASSSSHHRVQAHVREALRAQLRQLEELNAEHCRRTRTTSSAALAAAARRRGFARGGRSPASSIIAQLRRRDNEPRRSTAARDRSYTVSHAGGPADKTADETAVAEARDAHRGAVRSHEALSAQLRRLYGESRRGAVPRRVARDGPRDAARAGAEADARGRSAGVAETNIRNRTAAMDVDGARPNPLEMSDDVHAAMLERIQQLDSELKAQRAILAARGGTGGEGKASDSKKDSKIDNIDPMSQGDVAQLHNRINASRQGRDDHAAGTSSTPANNGPGGGGDQRSKRKYPRAVRRASAA